MKVRIIYVFTSCFAVFLFFPSCEKKDECYKRNVTIYKLLQFERLMKVFELSEIRSLVNMNEFYLLAKRKDVDFARNKEDFIIDHWGKEYQLISSRNGVIIEILIYSASNECGFTDILGFKVTIDEVAGTRDITRLWKWK